MTATESSSQGGTSPISEGEYTKFIIDSLSKGTRPVYVSANAGQFAPLLEIVLEDYNPDDLVGFNATLDALKSKHKAFNDVLGAAGSADETLDPDLYTSPKTGKEVLKRYNMNDVMSFPDIEWTVSGILQRSTVSLVVADGNTGKTFMWLDVVYNIAYGMKWLGRKTRQGRVLYIYAEGRAGLKQRQKAWLIDKSKINEAGLITDYTDQITFIPRPVHLLNQRQLLCDTIEDEPEIPEMVVIDTFSMCASGVEENNNTEVAKYLEVASYIKLHYGCHVTIIHHCNKSGGWRGASAFKDNVDTMITIERKEKDGPLKVECEKQRDGELFPPFYLNLKVVQIGINSFTEEPITSCVIEEATEDGTTTGSAQSKMPEKQAKMLEILAIHGSLTSGSWQRKCEEEAEITKSAFNYNVKALLEANHIAKNDYKVGKQERVSYSLQKDDKSDSKE